MPRICHNIYFWVFMTTRQCHGKYRICHNIYMLEVTYMLPRFHPKQVTHQSKRDIYFQHTSEMHRLHIHAHKRCPRAQRPIFHTKCKYMHPAQQVQYNMFFNTTASTQRLILHQHCLLEHYSYNQEDGQHQEYCYIHTSTHKTNAASHAFPVLANHFLHLV